ncbi:hypothetical protein FACS1894219_03030 [Clostridia bacterium]|nr:hypothetical protein FACS1894219_03030 [Clostridia bacterium]
MDNKMFELSDELKNLREIKQDLEAQVKDTTDKIEDVDYRLATIMTESETQNFTRAGTMFCLTTKTRASAVGGDKSELHDALRANGYGDLICETVNASTLSSTVSAMIEENDDELPEWLIGKVNIFEKTTISVRKSTK